MTRANRLLEQYRHMLRRPYDETLVSTRKTGVAAIRELCPWLSESTTSRALRSLADSSRVYIALPTLRIKGVVRVGYLRGEGGNRYPLSLVKDGIYRTKIADTPRPANAPARVGNYRTLPDPLYGVEDANEYSEAMWSDRFVWDGGLESLKGYLVDGDRLPQSRAFYWLSLSRGFSSICEDTSSPRSSLVDRATVIWTTDALEGEEFEAWDGGYCVSRAVHCGACGGGRDGESCRECGTPWPELSRLPPRETACDNMAMPETVHAAFRRDHWAIVDPAIARAQEFVTWGEQFIKLATPRSESPRTRAIDVGD